MQQPGTPGQPAPPNPQQLRDQIREAVQRQVDAARAQAEAAADAAADQAADAPLTPTVVVRRNDFEQIPPQVVDITLMFFVTMFAIIVGFPIARAIARSIDRRTQSPRTPAEVSTQLSQLSQSVDAMAIEIERISEGQRFTTKLLSEQHARRDALPSGGELPQS